MSRHRFGVRSRTWASIVVASLLGAIPAWTSPASADDYFTYSGRSTLLCVTSAGVIKVKLKTATQSELKCARAEWTYNVIASNVDALGTKVQQDFDALRGDFQGQMDSQSEAVSALDERLTSLESRADALESQAADFQSLLADQGAQIQDMQSQFSDFQDQMQASIDSKASTDDLNVLADLLTGVVESLDAKASVDDFASTNDAVAAMAEIVDTKASQEDLDTEVTRAVDTDTDLQSQLEIGRAHV